MRPCISVGNISWGGTGKTPLCLWLLTFCHQKGLLPLLLSRGYKGSALSYPLVVSPGISPYVCGDEPYLLQQEAPYAKIVVDPRRERGLKWAWRAFKPDIIILDDGFQYRRLDRDLDLVLLSTQDLSLHWNKLIPVGTWREDHTALKRAHCFLINYTGQENTEKLEELIEERLFSFQVPIFTFRVIAKEVVEIHSQRRSYPSQRPYILVAGIGNPEKVKKTALDLFGYPPARFITFPDHHRYSPADWRSISGIARSLRAEIVCTPKDAVKLRTLTSDDCYTFLLDIQWEKGYCPPGISFSTWLSGKSIFKDKSSHRDI